MGSLQLVSPSRSSSMAEVSQFMDLQKSQQKLEQLLEIEFRKRAALEVKIQEHTSGIDKKLLKISKGYDENSVQGSHKSGLSLNYALPRIDFPRFDGSMPRVWILQCNNYFKIMPNISDAQMINFAIMHFDGRAFSWIQNLNMGDIGITWKQFLEVIYARFEDIRVSNIFMECNKLKQNGSYDDYVERFEELRARMVLHDSSDYYEDSFVASFLSGLSEELQSFINMFQPKTLNHTIELGRKHLDTLDASSKKLQQPDAQFSSSLATYRMDEPAPQGKLKPNAIPKPPTKLLMAAESYAQRKKELCYNCDKSYFFGHNLMMTAEEDIFEAQEAVEFGIRVETTMVQTLGEVQDSIRFMFGEEGFCTRGAVGIVENHQLNTPFSPRLHKVKGYHLILGRDWLKFCIPIKWDYLNMIFTAYLNGKKVKFKFLTTSVDIVVGPFLTNLMLKEMTDFDDIFMEGTDAGHGKSTLMLGFLIRRYSDTYNTSEERAEKHFEVDDMKFLKFQPWNQHSLYWTRGKEVVPMLKSLDDDAAGAMVLGTRADIGGINRALQRFTTEGLAFFADASAAFSCYKKNILVQKWSAADDNINYKLEPLIVLNTHLVNRESQEISQILVQRLKVRFQLATWEELQNIFCKYHHIKCSVLYTSVHQQIHKIKEDLPTTDRGENAKIEPLMVLGIRNLMWKGEMATQFLLQWLKTTPEFAIWGIDEFLRRKFLPFDPWGQGSSEAGGIVMTRVGVNDGDGDVKEKGSAPELIWEWRRSI